MAATEFQYHRPTRRPSQAEGGEAAAEGLGPVPQRPAGADRRRRR